MFSKTKDDPVGSSARIWDRAAIGVDRDSLFLIAYWKTFRTQLLETQSQNVNYLSVSPAAGGDDSAAIVRLADSSELLRAFCCS